VKRASFISAVVAAITACSLGDFGGYSDGDQTPDSGPPDAPASSQDGAGTSDDGSTTTTDAGSDAPFDTGASFCELNADAGFFCEDFEGLNPLLHFDRLLTKAGTVVVDERTMLVTAPASTESSEVGGVISAKAIGSRVRLSFSVRPEEINLATIHATQIAKIYFFGSTTYEVGIGIHGKDSSQLYAYEYSPGAYKEFGALPPLKTTGYTRFVIDARIDTENSVGPRLDVDRDGQRVVNGVALSPPNAQGTIEAIVGTPYTQAGHGPWKLRFDDILMGLP
jgi:hypothetical protein